MEHIRAETESETIFRFAFLLCHRFDLHLIQNGMTASTRVCCNMISLTHTPYPVTGMAWSSKGSDTVGSGSGSLRIGSLLFGPFLAALEKKDWMDFWLMEASLRLRFLVLLLLLIPDVLPSKGGGSPRHGSFRRLPWYHSRSAKRMAVASSSVKLW